MTNRDVKDLLIQWSYLAPNECKSWLQDIYHYRSDDNKLMVLSSDKIIQLSVQDCIIRKDLSVDICRYKYQNSNRQEVTTWMCRIYDQAESVSTDRITDENVAIAMLTAYVQWLDDGYIKRSIV